MFGAALWERLWVHDKCDHNAWRKNIIFPYIKHSFKAILQCDLHLSGDYITCKWSMKSKYVQNFPTRHIDNCSRYVVTQSQASPNITSYNFGSVWLDLYIASCYRSSDMHPYPLASLWPDNVDLEDWEDNSTLVEAFTTGPFNSCSRGFEIFYRPHFDEFAGTFRGYIPVRYKNGFRLMNAKVSYLQQCARLFSEPAPTGESTSVLKALKSAKVLVLQYLTFTCQIRRSFVESIGLGLPEEITRDYQAGAIQFNQWLYFEFQYGRHNPGYVGSHLGVVDWTSLRPEDCEVISELYQYCKLIYSHRGLEFVLEQLERHTHRVPPILGPLSDQSGNRRKCSCWNFSSSKYRESDSGSCYEESHEKYLSRNGTSESSLSIWSEVNHKP